MEARKTTTAGVLFWTPAPARTSPTSSVMSEEEWEDEDGGEAGNEDDFLSQMDENGIIGLSEALEKVELAEVCGEADAECHPAGYPRPLNPEEADPSGQERDTPPEEWSYDMSEHLSHTEASGEEGQLLSPCDGLMSSLKAEVEKDGGEEGKRSDGKGKRKMAGRAGSSINKDQIERIRSPRSPVVDSANVFNHHCPVSQSVTVSTFPHLLHFTAEELAHAPGIEAETFPDMGFTESLPESHSSHISLGSSPRGPSEKHELKGFQTAAVFPQQVTAHCHRGPVKSDKHLKQPGRSQRRMSQPCSEATHSRTHPPSTTGGDSLKSRLSPEKELRTPRARTKAAEVKATRKDSLSYRTPDFSKVEPRVRFPKGGYKPPTSRRSYKRESLSPQPPIVIMSPADIVKEVLLNATDGSDSKRPPRSAPLSTVPQEFRCRQQATTLLEQLQEDYNRLLTKYAEAENTIDRLRLEAKVNLYSDPPKPGYLVQSGMSQDTSKFMTLDFPQAQRPEISSPSLQPNAHQNVQAGQQLARILYAQADKFLQQLQTFQSLLKREKLKPFEQTKGLSHLAEGLSSLERGYLLVSDEHKLRQQQGTETDNFDPDRELEGLIYQCGLHMDELKEQVERMRQEQLTCEAPPSPPPQPTSEGGETPTHPQTPPVPLLVDPGRVVEVEVSSASEERDEEEAGTGDEETLNSLYLKPVRGKRRRDEPDLPTLMDHYQSFKELPRMVDHSVREGALLSLGTDMQPGDEETKRRGQGAGNIEVQKSPVQRKVESDHLGSPVGKKQTSRSSPPSRRASSQSVVLPVHPPSSQRSEMRRSHSSSLSSLGEITAAERNSKLQTEGRRVLSQDGIISPETDSGFVGSESSRLTPAAATSPLHQRASQSSVSVHQEGEAGEPQTPSVSAPSPGASQLRPEQPSCSRLRQRRRTFSCSPQRWPGQAERARAGSGTSEFGLESDSTHTVSEDAQSDQYADSINSPHGSHSSSSSSARHHHGDPLGGLGPRQVANRNNALQALQAEVSRLEQRLEICLRNKRPLSSTRAAPSAQEQHSQLYMSTPLVSPVERCQSDVSRGRRERQTFDEAEDESTLRRAARKRSPCVDRQKPQRDVLTVSDLGAPTPPSQAQVSRCTQTSSAAPDSCCSHTHADLSQRTHSGPGGGRREPTPPSSRCRLCPLCGRPEALTGSQPGCRRDSDSRAHTGCQTAQSPDGAARSRYAAAPPALLQCMPVCPPPLLMCSHPVYVCPASSMGTSSGVRGHGEVRERMRRSLSADKHGSLDSSLHRAIRAARRMKHTSRHMARSLATGLQYHELLTQSCSR